MLHSTNMSTDREPLNAGRSKRKVLPEATYQEQATNRISACFNKTDVCWMSVGVRRCVAAAWRFCACTHPSAVLYVFVLCLAYSIFWNYILQHFRRYAIPSNDGLEAVRQSACQKIYALLHLLSDRLLQVLLFSGHSAKSINCQRLQ